MTSLALTGDPGPSLAEGGTLQLSAMAVLDDHWQYEFFGLDNPLAGPGIDGSASLGI